MDVQISSMLVMSNKEKIMPAMAAARGVLMRRRIESVFSFIEPPKCSLGDQIYAASMIGLAKLLFAPCRW